MTEGKSRWFEAKENRYEVVHEDDDGFVIIGHRPDGSTFEAGRVTPEIPIPVKMKVTYAQYPDGSFEIVEVDEQIVDPKNN